jgi:hypothetical protein
MPLIIEDREGFIFSGMPNAEERDAAMKIYIEWQSTIPKIENNLISVNLLPKDPSKRSENACLWRWELGNSLGLIIDNNPLIRKSEINQIVWDAIRLHLSERFKKTDRDKKNRDSLKNCYRLSKFSKKKVLKLTWRAWSDWLDRKSLHNSKADKWLNKNLDMITNLTSDQFRSMTKFFHNNVTEKGKIEFHFYSDEEFNSLWDDKLNEFIATLESED